MLLVIRLGEEKPEAWCVRQVFFVRYKKKYIVTTNSNHKQPIFDNVLNRQFQIDEPNRAYVSDITSIPTYEGWLYMTVIIDLFSQKVVGWSMSILTEAFSMLVMSTGGYWRNMDVSAVWAEKVIVGIMLSQKVFWASNPIKKSRFTARFFEIVWIIRWWDWKALCFDWMYCGEC